MSETDKIMFEIYCEPSRGHQYRVVYYTELNERNKEKEIARAMAAESIYDGFITTVHRAEAKACIDAFLSQYNGGQKPDLTALQTALLPYA